MDAANQRASRASPGSNQRAMSTFQKLQMLKKKGGPSRDELGGSGLERPEQPPCHRKAEPPIHKLVRKAAAEMPKNHLEDIKKLKMHEYLLANQNAVNGPLGHLYTQTDESRTHDLL